MELAAYFRAVWWRAWNDARRAVIPHSIKTLIRDAAVLIFLGVFAWLWQRKLIESGVMSSDNIKDSFVWIGLTALAALAVFALWFFVEGLFLVPYKMWKEAKATGDTLIASGTLGPKDRWSGPDIDEGPAKAAAKTKIGVAARDYLGPAMKALLPYYAEARDAVQRTIKVQGVRGAFGKACDRIRDGADDQHPTISVYDLMRADRLQKLTLHEAQSDYYYNYCLLMRGVKLTYELIESLAPMSPGLVAKLKALHDEWIKVQQAAIQEHIRLGKEDLELSTVGQMHTHVQKDLGPPDWDALTQK
jgi:hypothetical protein